MRSCGELPPNGDGYAVALRAENQPSSSHCFSQIALSFECLIRIGSSIVNTQKSDARQPWGHNAPIPPRRRRMRSIPQGIFLAVAKKNAFKWPKGHLRKCAYPVFRAKKLAIPLELEWPKIIAICL